VRYSGDLVHGQRDKFLHGQGLFCVEPAEILDDIGKVAYTVLGRRRRLSVSEARRQNDGLEIDEKSKERMIFYGSKLYGYGLQLIL